MAIQATSLGKEEIQISNELWLLLCHSLSGLNPINSPYKRESHNELTHKSINHVQVQNNHQITLKS